MVYYISEFILDLESSQAQATYQFTFIQSNSRAV